MKCFPKFWLVVAGLVLISAPEAWAAGSQAESWGVKEYLSLVAVLLSSFALALSLYKDWRGAQGTLIRGFQGNKDAIAYMAYKISHDRWERRFRFQPKFREEALTALCMAWSPAADECVNVLVLDALLAAQAQGYGKTVNKVLNRLSRQYAVYQEGLDGRACEQQVQALQQLHRRVTATARVAA